MTEPSALWASLGPAVLILVTAAVAGVLYAARLELRGPFEDPEMTARGATPLLPMGFRHFFAWLSEPLVRVLVRARVSADAITLFSLLLAVAAAVSVAGDHFALGGWLYLATGLCDYFDGRVARATGSAGARGAVLDSVVDRYAEGALLVGLAWSYRAEPTLVVVLLALTGSFLVPYVRARGEAAGVSMQTVGIMQRPERVLLVGSSLALSPLAQLLVPSGAGWPHHLLAAAGLAVVAIASHLTAVHRLRHVRRALDGHPERRCGDDRTGRSGARDPARWA